MEELIFGISGVRGIVGKSLTIEVMTQLGKAFGSYLLKGKGDTHGSPFAFGKTPVWQPRGLPLQFKGNRISPSPLIVVGRDARKSGELLKEAFIEGMLSTGCSVIDIGLSPTPAVLFNVRALNTQGGAVITASHNSSEWNGIKFANEKGQFLDTHEISKLYEIYKFRDFITIPAHLKVRTTDNKGIERHMEKVISSIDSGQVKAKHFKVVFDPVQGALAKEGKLFLKQLGCEFWQEITQRAPEPTQENLGSLSKKVRQVGADIGFATDPDGDRLSIVNELGDPLGEEYTLPLVASWVLIKNEKSQPKADEPQAQKIKNQKLVVTNLSTSRMIEDVVTQNGCKLIRTPVGEVNVVNEMLQRKAILGGEGNGGIIDPNVHYTRDALVGMGRLLEYMAISGEKISTLANRIPKYYMLKEKVSYPQGSNFGLLSNEVEFKLCTYLTRRLKSSATTHKLNHEDGLRIDFNGGWIHLRKSNTEPILRIICETSDKELTNLLIKEVRGCSSKLLHSI